MRNEGKMKRNGREPMMRHGNQAMSGARPGPLLRGGALLTLCALSLLLAPGLAMGQSKTGTSIGQFLLIEPSARLAGMANSGVGLTEGIQSVYYNTGALGQIEGPELQFTHSEWFAGIGYEYAAAAYPTSSYGTLFASVTALNSGDIDVRTVDQPLGTGERYSVNDLAIGLGYGRPITDRFSAGIQINYVQETIWHSSLSTFTGSVGTIYKLSPHGAQLGAGISNYGLRARFGGRDLAIQYDADPSQHGDNSVLPADQFTDKFSVPVLFRVGVSLPRRLTDASKVVVTADGYHPSDNDESMSVGGAWTWKDAFSLRAGYQNLFLKDSEVGLTFGAGLQGRVADYRFQFDYAWADFGRLQDTQRFTFVVGF
jgi:hypothetical protein